MANNRKNRYGTDSGSRYGQSDYYGSRNGSYGMNSNYADDIGNNRYSGYDRDYNDRGSRSMGYAGGDDYNRYSTDRYSSGMGTQGYGGQRYAQDGSGYRGGYGMSRGYSYDDDDYGNMARGRDNYYSGGIYGGSRYVGSNYGSNYYGGEHDSRNTGRYSSYYGPASSGMTRNEHFYDGYTGDDYPGSER